MNSTAERARALDQGGKEKQHLHDGETRELQWLSVSVCLCLFVFEQTQEDTRVKTNSHSGPVDPRPFLYEDEGHKGRGSWPFTSSLCLRRSEMFSVTTADATRQSSVAGEFDSVFQAFHTQIGQRTLCV